MKMKISLSFISYYQTIFWLFMNQNVNFSNNMISGGTSSKDEISPCSSEEFFQNFPKRATFRGITANENGSYKPMAKSPSQDHREANKNKSAFAPTQWSIKTFPPLASWTFETSYNIFPETVPLYQY